MTSRQPLALWPYEVRPEPSNRGHWRYFFLFCVSEVRAWYGIVHWSTVSCLDVINFELESKMRPSIWATKLMPLKLFWSNSRYPVSETRFTDWQHRDGGIPDRKESKRGIFEADVEATALVQNAGSRAALELCLRSGDSLWDQSRAWRGLEQSQYPVLHEGWAEGTALWSTGLLWFTSNSLDYQASVGSSYWYSSYSWLPQAALFRFCR